MKNTIVSAMRIKRSDVIKLLSVWLAVCLLMLAPIGLWKVSAAVSYVGSYEQFVGDLSDNNNYKNFRNAIDGYNYRVYFWAAWISPQYGSENASLIGMGSTAPIKFLYSNGGVGIAIPANAQSECRMLISNFYSGHYGSASTASGSGYWQYQPYIEDDNIGYGYFRYVGRTGTTGYEFINDTGISTQKFFYGFPAGSDDADFQYTTGWVYVDGTGAPLYDHFADDEPHKEIVTVTGGGEIVYEDFYQYQYDTDSEGNVINSGTFDFDFGLSATYDKWFRGGFVGQIREWIRDGQNGAGNLQFHLLEFHTTSNGKWLHAIDSSGIDVDFDDEDGLAYKLARVTVPFLQADVIICTWLVVIQSAMGVKFIGRAGDDE